MRVIKPPDLALLQHPYMQDGRFWLSVGVGCFFDLEDPASLLPEQELWQVVPEELGEDFVLDEGRPKARGEALLLGTCRAPGGEPAPTVRAGFAVGQMAKELRITGRRIWKKDMAGNFISTQPEPFFELRVTPESAFGGEGFADNEAGLGYLPEGVQPDLTVGTPLPRAELARSDMKTPWQNAGTAGFWPLAPGCQQRQSLFGTADEQWAKHIFPENPRDTNPFFYNAAPPDQQLSEGFFSGDEPIVLFNMYLGNERYESRLPGRRVRCFATVMGAGGGPIGGSCPWWPRRSGSFRTRGGGC